MQNVKVIKAKYSDKPVIANLIQLYLYDMTEYYPDWPICNDGCYEYNMMEEFWQHPYLFYYREELVGFSFVIDRCPITQEKQCWFMAELFLLKNYRKRGLASAIVEKIFEMHKGKWHIGVITKNIVATKFWDKTLSNSSVKDYKHDGEDWKVFEKTVSI